MHLLGLIWTADGPVFRVADFAGSAPRTEAVAGFHLNWRPSANAPRCLGHVPFRSDRGATADCMKQPTPGSRRCDRCSMLEATFASNLHHAHTRGRAELDPSIAKHLQQPNQLYVAGFRDGSIKVGTSTLSRVDTRLTEQGAWLVRIVADAADGFAVREIEDAATEQLGLRQAVASTRKLHGLVNPITDEQLDRALGEAEEQVHGLIAQHGDARITAASAQWAHPMHAGVVNRKLHRYPLQLETGSHDLTFEAAVGRLLIARRSSGTDEFAVDPAPLFGLALETGDFAPDPIAIQDSLF